MTPSGEDTPSNLSVVDIIYLYFNRLLGIFGLTSNASFNLWNDDISVKLFLDKYEDLIFWLSFDDFQLKLLKGFLVILFVIWILILFAWKVYGCRICLRFMKPGKLLILSNLFFLITMKIGAVKF